MTQYLSPLVSCLVCREVKSAKGLFTHFAISHTEEGNQKHIIRSRNGSHLGAQKVKENCADRRAKLEIEYNKNPNTCGFCDRVLDFDHKHNRFCSHSCSAKKTNNERDYSSFKSGPKPGAKPKERPKYTKIKQCVVCGCYHPRYGKTCGAACLSTLLSMKTIERIKQNKRSNFRRDKKSYLEDSFEKWLVAEKFQVRYEDEYTIRNHITGKWYFVDFYFPDLNLIVELDGKQHEKPKHKEADRIRDEFIINHLGIDVFRISHKEYQEGSRIDQLSNMLRRVGPLSNDLRTTG